MVGADSSPSWRAIACASAWISPAPLRTSARGADRSGGSAATSREHEQAAGQPRRATKAVRLCRPARPAAPEADRPPDRAVGTATAFAPRGDGPAAGAGPTAEVTGNVSKGGVMTLTSTKHPEQMGQGRIAATAVHRVGERGQRRREQQVAQADLDEERRSRPPVLGSAVLVEDARRRSMSDREIRFCSTRCVTSGASDPPVSRWASDSSWPAA